VADGLAAIPEVGERQRLRGLGRSGGGVASGDAGSSKRAGSGGETRGVATPTGQGLTRAERVRLRRDFDQVHRRGTKVPGRFFLVIARRREVGPARLGMAVSRKLGGSVVRNRAKRLIRELFRRNKPRQPVDLVVIPRKELLVAEYRLLEQDFRKCVGRCLTRELGPRGESQASHIGGPGGPPRL